MTDRVARLELFHVAATLPDVFHPAWIPGYPQGANRFTLARVTTKSGKVGLAAGAAFGEEREGLGSVIGPHLVDTDALDLPAVHQRLAELSFLGWRNFWLEGAFYDIAAQHDGKPLWKYLGGKEPTLRAYASMGERRPPDAMGARVHELAERGFKLVKIRVHEKTLEADVARLRAAAEAAKKVGVDLAVDANQGWRVTLFEETPAWTLDRALAFAKECHALGVKWLEEPLEHHDYDGYRELRKASLVPIAGAELVEGWPVLERLLAADALDIYQPDATFSGVADAKRCIDAAIAAGRRYAPHTWTNGFGLWLNAHLLSYANARQHATTMLEYPIDEPGWSEAARDACLTPGLRAHDGEVRLPDSPGLGAHLDKRALSRWGHRFYNGTKLSVARDMVRSRGLLDTLRTARARREKK